MHEKLKDSGQWLLGQIDQTTGVQWATAWVVAHYTGIPGTLRVLFWAILLDAFMGILASIYDGKPITSREFTRGFIRKGCILLLCFLGHPITDFLVMDLHMPSEMVPDLGRWMPVAFIFGEGISITESLFRCGVPLPGPLVQILIKGKRLVPKSATKEEMAELFEETTTTIKESVSTKDGQTIAKETVKIQTITSEPAPKE